VVQSGVMDSRSGHLQHSCSRRHLPGRKVTVAHHHPVAISVDQISLGVQMGSSFRLQANRQHLLGGQTTQLVQVDPHWVADLHINIIIVS
jgi:hypothetical protein